MERESPDFGEPRHSVNRLLFASVDAGREEYIFGGGDGRRPTLVTVVFGPPPCGRAVVSAAVRYLTLVSHTVSGPRREPGFLCLR